VRAACLCVYACVDVWCSRMCACVGVHWQQSRTAQHPPPPPPPTRQAPPTDQARHQRAAPRGHGLLARAEPVRQRLQLAAVHLASKLGQHLVLLLVDVVLQALRRALRRARGGVQRGVTRGAVQGACVARGGTMQGASRESIGVGATVVG
jgi:hypothetical protein